MWVEVRGVECLGGTGGTASSFPLMLQGSSVICRNMFWCYAGWRDNNTVGRRRNIATVWKETGGVCSGGRADWLVAPPGATHLTLTAPDQLAVALVDSVVSVWMNGCNLLWIKASAKSPQCKLIQVSLYPRRQGRPGFSWYVKAKPWYRIVNPHHDNEVHLQAQINKICCE